MQFPERYLELLQGARRCGLNYAGIVATDPVGHHFRVLVIAPTEGMAKAGVRLYPDAKVIDINQVLERLAPPATIVAPVSN